MGHDQVASLLKVGWRGAVTFQGAWTSAAAVWQSN